MASRTPKNAPAVIERDPEIMAMEKTLGHLEAENYRITEQLQNIDMMLDQKGWQPLFDYGADGGLTLGQIKAASEQIRELMVGNPFVGRGALLRICYVWGGGLEFGGRLRTSAKIGALTAEVLETCDKPANERYVFSNSAHEEFERSAFSDGNVFLLGSDALRTFQRVPIAQITGDLRNPDNSEEIWAYRRSWYRNPDAENEKDYDEQVKWYYTDIYEGARAGFISYNGRKEEIERTKTLLPMGFNKQIGWAYGVPDALAIIAWARLYKEFLVNGYIMSRAMAKFAYKVTTSSARGGANASAEIQLPGQAGSTAVEGQGNSLSAMSNAGKGYDFDAGRPLAAAMAAGLGVSLVALLSDPAVGAGGNGTAATLDAPARATAALRRKVWDDYWVRIFRYLGNRKKLVTTWHDLTDDQLQRILQGLTLLNGSGLFEGKVMQKEFAAAWGIADPGEIPNGYMVPNNSNSLPRKDVDADGTTPAAGDDQTQPAKPPSPTAGSGQGKSSGRGKAPNDHSTDTPT